MNAHFLKYAKQAKDIDKTDSDTPFTLEDLNRALVGMSLNKRKRQDWTAYD